MPVDVSVRGACRPQRTPTSGKPMGNPADVIGLRILYKDRGGEQRVSIYLVDRDLPGVTLGQLAEAQRRILGVIEQMAEAGKSVRYFHSTFVPGESHMMCLFEAASVAWVMEANEAAHFPLLRVTEALDLTPKAGEPRHPREAAPRRSGG